MFLRSATGSADKLCLRTSKNMDEILRTLVAFGLGCLIMLLLATAYLSARQALTNTAPSPAGNWNIRLWN